MHSQSYNEKRIKRLEIMVVILSILFVTSIGVSIYSAFQIRSVASKIPSYTEIKNDIKTLNNLYKVSEVQVPKAYNYTKEKTVQAYEYSKEKTGQLINFIKDKTTDEKKTKH